MAMKPECIEAVALAIGKKPTEAQIKDIEKRIQEQRTRLGNDPEVMAMSAPDRLIEASKRASEEYLADQQNKVRRVLLQAQADSRNMQQLKDSNEGNWVHI